MSAIQPRPFWKTLGLKEDQPELLAAQLLALARQIPLLYVILTINSVIICRAFIGRAPVFLTTVVPILLCLACAARGIMWYAQRGAPAASTAVTIRHLRKTTVLAVVLGVLFISWSLSLYPYGTDMTRLHLAFYVVVTATGCALCLMHLPAAALMLVVIVIAPFSVVYIASGQATLISVAVNSIIIYLIIVHVLMIYFKHFEAMVASQANLRNQNAEVARLNEKASEIEARRRKDRQADLDRIAATFSRSIEGVTRVLGEVAAHNTRQSSDLASRNDTVLHSLKHVTEAAATAEHALVSVAESTASLSSAIGAIRGRMGEAAAISTTVEDRAGSADQAMAVLDSTVGRIDSIAAMIKAIAVQIDLIALNATIEAARAGEAGRGFAVVATEIKMLAARTAHATDDIGRHIGDVKIASRAANASVAAMRTAVLDLRAVSNDVAGALEVQTIVTADIRGFVGTAVDGAVVMRHNVDDMSNSAQLTQTSAKAMLDQCAILGTETNVLAREVDNFVGFIKAA